MNRTDIARVWVTEDAVMIQTVDGRRGTEYFSDYRRLRNATADERAAFRMSHFGIHWPELDEDLSFDGFFNKNQFTQHETD